ncbi:MAG: glutamate racemase [Clostridia bacterium]|nr:glutamate racemase [Clostridia bacterium]
MKKEYILFIDSGIGGFSVLKETINILSYNYLYYADNNNAPYGSHSSNEIKIFLKDIITNLSQKYKFKIVVLACNTATTSAIEYLRSIFPNLIFIGIEPAINIAIKNQFNNILVIATPTTIKQKKYINLVKKTNYKIKSKPMHNLARNIEMYYLNKNIINKVNLLKNIYYLKAISKYYDCIILGCTHYSIIKNLLKNYINIPLIDKNKTISKIIKLNCNFLDKTMSFSTIKILLSNNDNRQKQKYIKILNQILAK